MNQSIINGLAIIGFLWFVAFIVVALGVIFQLFCECVDKLKCKYRYKHRFDKPPTAKCFCCDCVRHDNETERCYKFDKWYTEEDWFCWDAEPRDRKFEKRT